MQLIPFLNEALVKEIQATYGTPFTFTIRRRWKCRPSR